MLKFVGEFLPETFGKVEEIFSRSGAYARFKDLLEHRGMLEQWYEYEVKTCEQALREWCEGNALRLITNPRIIIKIGGGGYTPSWNRTLKPRNAGLGRY